MGLAAGPQHSTPDHLACLGHVEVRYHMAERAKEYATFIPVLGPGHWHNGSSDPCCVLAAEGRRGKHFDRWIDMHKILLAMHGEIIQAPGNWVFVVGDINCIVDNIAGMGYPLAADHELIVGV